MRLSESRIKEFIVHPEQEVRLTALLYFTASFTQDTSVMPLVIRAVEEYGRKAGYAMLRRAENLPQTEETACWLEDQLRGNLDPADIVDDNHRWAVGLVLSAADPALLLAGHAGAAELPLFPAPLAAHFRRRLEIHAWDWMRLWEALAQLGRETLEQRDFSPAQTDLGNVLLDAIARLGREPGLVADPLHDLPLEQWDPGLRAWMESVRVELLGRMRLESAVPMLVNFLGDEYDGVAEASAAALTRIGGDAVVREIARRWPEADEEFRFDAGGVLDDIHTDLAAETVLRVFGEAEEFELREFLAHTALRQLCEEAVDPVRRMLVDEFEADDPDRLDLQYALVAASTVMGARFPEYEGWYAEAVADRWGWEECEPGRMAEYVERFGITGGSFQRYPVPGDLEEPWDDEEWNDEDEPLDDEEWDEAEEDWDEEEEDWSDDEEEEAWEEEPEDKPVIAPPKPGRNDPCPCGSGKKYKKCCMRKDGEDKADDWLSI